MSEEEIRKILLCENIGELACCGLIDKLDESNNMDLNELKKQAIQCLLDLYEQEKEKRKYYEEELDATIKQSVSKHKIKAKIKELENLRECVVASNQGNIEISASIDILKELLEGE